MSISVEYVHGLAAFHGFIADKGPYAPSLQSERSASDAFRYEDEFLVAADPMLNSSGAFMVAGVQCRIQRYNQGQETESLELVEDSSTHWCDSQTWWNNPTAPVRVRGQVFVAVNEQSLVDVLDMPETATIQERFAAHQAAKSARWAELYTQLIELGMSKKEARARMRADSWKETEAFVRFAGELLVLKPSVRRLQRASLAWASTHVFNILGIPTGMFAGAMDAIRWYQSRICDSDTTAKV